MQNLLIIPQTIEAVFRKIETRLKKENEPKKLNSHELLELFGLFHDVLYEALNLIDNSTIVLFKTPKSHQTVWEIKEFSLAFSQNLLPSINYCSCDIFQTEVLLSRTQYTCKHILAARISQILEKFQTEFIRPSDLDLMLKRVYGRSSESADSSTKS